MKACNFCGNINFEKKFVKDYTQNIKPIIEKYELGKDIRFELSFYDLTDKQERENWMI